MFTFIVDEKDLTLEEGRLALDFANTLDWHASDHPIESLNTYADLINWSRKVGLVDAEEAAALIQNAEPNPDEAEAVRLSAIELREAIYQIFSTYSHGHDPNGQDLDTLNRYLAEALARTKIVQRANGFTWEWVGEPASLDWILGPIARSAADLLTSEDLKRVGECADTHGCGWLFLDTSKNHSRRWCSMESCGNRAKATRHYRRRQADEI